MRQNISAQVDDPILRGSTIAANKAITDIATNKIDTSGLASEGVLLGLLSYVIDSHNIIDGQYARTKLHFQLDGNEQLIIEDTATPANNKPLPVKITNSTQRTPTKTTVTDSTASPIAAGAIQVILITDTTFAGTILGDTATANTTYTFSTNGLGTLAAIDYTCTAGKIEILKIT